MLFFYILDLQGSQTDNFQALDEDVFFYILDLQGSQTRSCKLVISL